MVDDVVQPIVRPANPSRLKIIFIIEAFILVVVIVISVFLFAKRNTVTNTNVSITPTSTTQAENKMNVPMETTYKNPFKEEVQYENPFSQNTNPFDNLK